MAAPTDPRISDYWEMFRLASASRHDRSTHCPNCPIQIPPGHYPYTTLHTQILPKSTINGIAVQDAWRRYSTATAASYCKAVLCKFDSKSPERINNMRHSINKVMRVVQIAQLYVTHVIFHCNDLQHWYCGVVFKAEWKRYVTWLPIAKGAALDSYENQHSQCFSGTRVELPRQIQHWAQPTEGNSYPGYKAWRALVNWRSPGL